MREISNADSPSNVGILKDTGLVDKRGDKNVKGGDRRCQVGAKFKKKGNLIYIIEGRVKREAGLEERIPNGRVI